MTAYMNQNPHNLDLWQWICGMPKKVKSVIYYGKHRNIEVEDDVYAIVEYMRMVQQAHIYDNVILRQIIRDYRRKGQSCC